MNLLVLWVAQCRLLFALATRSQLNLNTISEFDIASFQFTYILTHTTYITTRAAAKTCFVKMQNLIICIISFMTC